MYGAWLHAEVAGSIDFVNQPLAPVQIQKFSEQIECFNATLQEATPSFSEVAGTLPAESTDTVGLS